MNYELAKKLKDKGFTQRQKRVLFEDSYIDSEGNLNTVGDVVYVPSLEELIEACGDKFHKLIRGFEGQDWIASGVDDIGEIQVGQGSNPSESIANLWLVLNK